jgi:hypothetical protein
VALLAQTLVELKPATGKLKDWAESERPAASANNNTAAKAKKRDLLDIIVSPYFVKQRVNAGNRNAASSTCEGQLL